MLKKRIIPCLDVRDGRVVKGVRFNNHTVVGDIVELARRYDEAGADELVFYDITASPDGRTADPTWVERVAREIRIPFCVAGGIRNVEQARRLLNHGADKISVNSPALERPELISELAREFGSQCVVVGIDSKPSADGIYRVSQFTGDPGKTMQLSCATALWIQTAQAMGAGEIVLNCMGHDGVRNGYDIAQLKIMRSLCHVPLIASGGAGAMADFQRVFEQTDVDGALAASVFHSGEIQLPALKTHLANAGLPVRLAA